MSANDKHQTGAAVRPLDLAALDAATREIWHSLKPDWPRRWGWIELSERTKDELRATTAEAIHAYLTAAGAPRITHGRHCTCTPCRVEDWTNQQLAPCGMHGASCPREYAPLGSAGQPAPAAGLPETNREGERKCR